MHPHPRLVPALAVLALFLSRPTAGRADFPAPTNNQETAGVPFTPPEEALRLMRLPPGFKATLFAAEPDVRQPIALCWDERGRLWVAENYTYSDSQERFDMKLRDRILIFEDADNDGRFDRRQVFADDLQMLTSIERGFGGVYALCPPHLLWIPAKDDRPAGPPQVLLDGFSTTAVSRHTFANGLKWGPDGWLYGRIGISSTSWIGVPATPQERRQPTAGGIWRYHPARKIYEPYCHGTTNPWGMDWDQHGEMFFINTVIGHLWHGIRGAHFKRMHGEDPYPRIYGLIDQHADHYHWDTGRKWSETRDAKGLTDTLGGGHAHVGMMIYQGTNWPREYRGKVFTLNLHGRRINVDRMERHGSGYAGKHEPDFMKTGDPWFRGIEISQGPDGGVYILDWSDIGECHENDGVHRTSGRIYKITYGQPGRPKETELTGLTDEELVKLQLSDNEWLVRMSRWELRERFARANEEASDELRNALGRLEDDQPTERTLIRLCWLRNLLGIGGFAGKEDDFARFPHLHQVALRLWIDRMALAEEKRLLPSARKDLRRWASDKGSPALRLELAGALQRDLRWNDLVLPDLLSHPEDAADHNLPLMYWYGIRDLPPAELATLFPSCRIPLVRQFIARRAAEDIDKDPSPLNGLLSGETSRKPGTPPEEAQTRSADILTGMTDALKGWRKARKPAAWDAFTARLAGTTDEALRKSLRDLNILFGDGRALDEVRAIALDANADVEARKSALATLIEAKSPDARKICEKLLTERSLALAAAQGLATFDDPAIAETLVRRWRNFYPHEHAAIVAALVSRPAFARVLLDHLGKGVVQRSDLTPLHARQIRSFNDPDLTRRLAATWGEVRESSADKKRLMAMLRSKLTPEFIRRGDPSQGRALFAGICAACHKLYGEGNAIGPDLTGGGRHDLGYLIENLVDPSAVVAADASMTVVTLKDGRVLNGIIGAKTDRTITVRMAGMETTVDRNEIARQEQLPISMMPEGLLTALNDDQLRNLFSYLMGNSQAPLPQTAR